MITKMMLWNLNKRSVNNQIRRLVDGEMLDILLLLEHDGDIAGTLSALNSGRQPEWEYAPGLCKRVTVFSRFAHRFLSPVMEASHFSIRELALPAGVVVLLCIFHLGSKMFQSGESQSFASTEVARAVREVEKDRGHTRTILAGDFNMNPFEPGMTAASGFNATMAAAVAASGHRTVNGMQYPFLYNPMWNYLGDRTPGPPGSHYYERNEQVCLYWHMFDQVLVRPQMIDRLRLEQLKLVDEMDGQPMLYASGARPRDACSDHLPLVFALNLGTNAEEAQHAHR